MVFEWVLSAFVGGFVGACVWFLGGSFWFTWRLAAVEGALVRLENSRYGMRSQDKQATQSEEMNAAMAEIGQILQDPTQPDKTKALIGLAAKYPSAAAKLARQFGLKI